MNGPWENTWTSLAPPEAVRVTLGRNGDAASPAQITAGSTVVLAASAPGASRHCRRFAASAGIELQRAYLAFPNAAAPAYLVEDTSSAVALFARTVLVTPPHAAHPLPVELALACVRRLRLWLLVRKLAPGRLVVGRKL
jgi:hypothetical protein